MPVIRRQTTDGVVVVPATYGDYSDLSSGAVAGITLGAVAGFLLILWMVYTCLNFGRPVDTSSSSVLRRLRTPLQEPSSPPQTPQPSREGDCDGGSEGQRERKHWQAVGPGHRRSCTADDARAQSQPAAAPEGYI
ncbi:hypothetical protein LZ30DRAFT_683786 [Colletotrichum cereale]|nr:hypothetical protein LZ30DRAFT_683786 [Colletotrichum cereale]